MRRRVLLSLWAALAVAAHVVPRLLPEPAARADFPTEADIVAEYGIQARLDAKTHRIDATASLTWRNRSPVEVTEMRLHLYLNAFKDERSTFMRETLGSHRGHRFDKGAPGRIDLTSFRRKDGPELIDPAHLEFLHDDDGNTDDQTVVRIPLKTPIPAGGEAAFQMAWQSTMPRVFARTGEAGNGAFFMVAQWFPKPGVWEQEGGDGAWGWNCHQFHGSSEFYADYAAYDVWLTVPKRFEGKLGASGARVGDVQANEDGTVTAHYRAWPVHDFAWVCGGNFELRTAVFDESVLTEGQKAERARMALILGVDEATLRLPPVTVTFLLQPEHLDQLDRHRTAVFNALAYMGTWFGPYPYATLTVVDPDHRGQDAGGMEYPTLITGGTRYVRAARQLSPEGVLVHEFGHQHFYGLVGSNEFRHAWMDEGLNTYGTAKVLERAYDGYASATWYAGLPHYGEAPFEFRGLAPTARRAMPWVGPLFDDTLRVPFGDVQLVSTLAHAVGVESPPGSISLWGPDTEVTPLGFLREMPGLTHLQPRPSVSREWERGGAAARPVVDPIAGRRAWEYMDRASYGTNSYARTASSLRTLEGYLGEDVMLRAMHTYCERYRYAHPRPEQFFATVDEVARRSGKGDVRWLLAELFERATRMDYGIDGVEVTEVPRLGAQDPKAAPTYESTVLVRRYGGTRLPIDVRVRFGDGRVRDFLWGHDDSLREYGVEPTEDGGVRRGALRPGAIAPVGTDVARVSPARAEQQRWAKLRFRGPSKAVSAEVDPYRAYGLDADRTNDGRSTRRDAGAALQLALRALGWVEMSTSFYGGL